MSGFHRGGRFFVTGETITGGFKGMMEYVRSHPQDGPHFFTPHWGEWKNGPSFMDRLAEAQRTYDNAKPGDCIQIDEDLWPYINRTEK